MATLKEKVSQLRQTAIIASRLADWYDNEISQHGIQKVEAFYTDRLGLNHIERKAQFDGLELRRTPRDSEKIAVKGVSEAQDTAKDQVRPLLLALRQELISDGLQRIENLRPAKLHTLVLLPPAEFRQHLKDRLIKIYEQGRQLVAQELNRQAVGFKQEDDFEELDTLIDSTESRVANDVQARIIAAAARFTLLGLTGAALLAAIRTEVETGSVSYIDRTSTGLANVTINIGRMDEAQSRKGDWERVEYSAILDQNVCGPCAAEDGQEAANESELTPVPNPECLGGDWCRCFHVFITQ